MSVRLDKAHRLRQILNAGIDLAIDGGLYSENVTRTTVATALRVSRPLISHYYKSDIELRKAILKHVIDGKTPTKEHQFVIIAQAVSVSDPLIDTIPKKLKKDALAWISR